ncbi:TIM23 complex component [Irineochytrium annulatum]|nr:TIM23 complex component [Irineochytrium annulatum]
MQSVLPWTDYFQKRKEKKFAERVGALCGALIGFAGGSYYFLAVVDFDPTEYIFDIIDPSAAYSIGALLVGVAGYTVGVLAGGYVWRVMQRTEILRAIDMRDKEFFRRIQSSRPSEVKLSIDTPMPDYYGEEVTSVPGYRAWLKKQRDLTNSKK